MPGPAVPPASESSWFVDRKVSPARAARGIPTVRWRPVAPRGRRWDTHDRPIHGEKNGTADHRESTRKPDVYAYDVESDANDINQSLHDIIAQYKRI
jgi:hypothetical protein